MKNLKHILVVIAFVASFTALTIAQMNMKVVTLKAKPIRQLDNIYAKRFNQRVSSKDSNGNRAVNPKTNNIWFPVKPNTTIVDSRGRSQGVVAAPEVRINYGATRKLLGSDGKQHVFHQAWSTNLQSGVAASGWIQRSALPTKPKMPTVTAKRPPTGPRTAYTITGGNPQSSKFGMTVFGQFVPFKVTRGYAGGGRNASDYLRRPTGVVNVSYNLPGKGGVSHDTYRPGTTFQRAKSIRSIVSPLYLPGGTKPVSNLRFVYGTVQTPTGPRFGWIPLAALKRKP